MSLISSALLYGTPKPQHSVCSLVHNAHSATKVSDPHVRTQGNSWEDAQDTTIKEVKALWVTMSSNHSKHMCEHQ